MLAVTAVLLGACAQQAPVMRPDRERAMDPKVTSPPAGAAPQVVPQEVPPMPEPVWIDPMADLPGDRTLPDLRGSIEKIDCTSGVDELHARMALEARGGQIASFAYYSKWKPYTCSLDIKRDDPQTKWRLTADGATRVQTPNGSFLIRALADSYLFEFQNVRRQRFCGMLGYINGTMTITRESSNPQCSVNGLLDRGE